VLVDMGATGVCHSDLSVLDGKLPNPVPLVLGHEGAGTVLRVGAGVRHLAPGDRVVLSWLAQCGSCFHCQRGEASLCESANDAMFRASMLDGTTRFTLDGRQVHHMAGLGTFSRRCVVSEHAAVKVPESLGMAQAALLGCGVLTGFGAAVNTARVRPGETVAVLGCGGVGLNAIQGAQISGAGQVIAVDPSQERRELALRMGATTALAPSEELVTIVRDLTEGRGVDVALEVAGLQDTVNAAVRLTRKGGRIVLVGAGPREVALQVPAYTGMVLTEKTVVGSFYGSSLVARDVPMLVALYESGQLLLDELVTREFGFTEINDAVAYCRDQRGARAVVIFD
jgi:alcohol dehydrogenase/S-(hydroxymethyl)glutathione dehydrogenase/alcohol dehydrogenase